CLQYHLLCFNLRFTFQVLLFFIHILDKQRYFIRQLRDIANWLKQGKLSNCLEGIWCL
ncbi:hypothetical protein GCK32_009374, partial [Trichostrongylus colubriformis]